MAESLGIIYPGYVQIGPSGILEMGWGEMAMTANGSPPQLVSQQRCDSETLKQLSGDGELLVYLHGYNVSFGCALQTAAQLKVGLGMKGPVLCIDWVSKNCVKAYKEDEAIAEGSVIHMKSILDELVQQPGPVHFLAHSMGNRVLLGALHEYHLEHKEESNVFGEIFFVAPDVNFDVFKQRIPAAMLLSGKLAPAAQHPSGVTLYANSEDKALCVSEKIHKDTRAGSGQGAVGMDTIRCESVGRDIIKHSYYLEKEVLNDIKYKIETGAPGSEREHLEQDVDDDHIFYLSPSKKKSKCVKS